MVKKGLTLSGRFKTCPIFFVSFFLGLAFLSPSFCHAFTSEPPPRIAAQYLSLIRLEAPLRTSQLVPEDPSDAYEAWIQHTQSALELVFWEEDSRFSELEKFHLRAELLLKNTSLNPEWRAFLEAEMDLQLAFVRLKMGKEWSAAWQIRSAFLQLRKLQELYPDFLPVYKSLGLLEIIISLAPSPYQWVLSILGMKTDTGQGLGHLHSALDDPLVGEEARYWLAMVRALLFDEVQEGLQHMQDLPSSTMKSYVMHHLLMKNANTEEAVRWLEGEDLSNYPPQIYHSMGMAALQKADWDLSEKYFLGFLENCACRHLIKSTYFRLYQLALFQNNMQKAQSYRRRVEDRGLSVAEADQIALRELKEQMHPFLIQARLSTAGGYAEEAAEWLQKAETIRAQNPEWEAEWRYRNARLQHLKGNKAEAYEAYLSALQLALDDGRYIFANAALKAAELAAEWSDYAQSRQLFIRAMSFKKHPYVSSVETKAKYGLSQLGE